jgi:crotonobetainyl-CoA:carnitine CoA-transferase CaiB-like acyl-CoA transferase
MGADVVKVEEPTTGDYLRGMPPLGPRGNLYFEHLHRSQRSLAVDLKDPRGREVLMALAWRADVLLEGFRPGVMNRLGLGFDELAGANPGLIYCSLTAFGQGPGPRQTAAHDLNILGLSGLLAYLTDGAGRTLPPPIQLADVAGGGLLAVVAVLGALVARGRTGRGCHLDVAMLDGLRIIGVLQRAEGAGSGRYPGPDGLPLAGNLACYNVYSTADGGTMALGALEPKFWAAFCAGVERPAWVDRQFGPSAQQRAMTAEVAAVFAARTRTEWEGFAALHDCCLTPVVPLAEAVGGPMAAGRPPDDGFPVAVRGGSDPAGPVLGPRPAPALGRDTAAILQDLGISAANIRAWAQAGVIRT